MPVVTTAANEVIAPNDGARDDLVSDTSGQPRGADARDSLLVRERPPIDESTIVRALEDAFDVRVNALSFLQLGNDAESWSYRVDDHGGTSSFLKVRAGSGDPPGMTVPALLGDRRLRNVMSPVRTADGRSFVRVEDFALGLFPWVDARPGAEAGMTEALWRLMGETVRRVHETAPAPDLTRLARREPFVPTRRELLPTIADTVEHADGLDPIGRAFAAAWRAHRTAIDELVASVDEMGGELARSSVPSTHVLCHGDLHTFNVLVDDGGRLWIVDWDEATIAPRERDLMFVVVGIDESLVSRRDTECFLEGYGDVDVDPRLLSYYRRAWAVQDIAANGEEALLLPRLGDASRRDAVRGFEMLFDPGSIVDIATREEHGPR